MGLGIILLVIGVLGIGMATSTYKALPGNRMTRLKPVAHLATVSIIATALGIILICYPPK